MRAVYRTQLIFLSVSLFLRSARAEELLISSAPFRNNRSRWSGLTREVELLFHPMVHPEVMTAVDDQDSLVLISAKSVRLTDRLSSLKCRTLFDLDSGKLTKKTRVEEATIVEP